ncbi:MAG: response regulator [Pseudomonadota bacterium]
MATILVVDDNAVNRAFLVTLLGYGKHRLLEAADGVEGLAVLQQERPDLVISDILMPHMDGHEFVTRIHANPETADTPVIFYTAGYHEAEARMIARACGVSCVLAKPAEPELILRTVNKALGLPDQPIDVPELTTPPVEGSRFITIDSQVAEYMVELESSSQLIAQLVALPEHAQADTPERALAASRLGSSLAKLQAASGRLSALVQVSREVAAEEKGAFYGEVSVPSLASASSPAKTSRPFTPSSRIDPAETPANDADGSIRISPERAKFQARLAKALQFAGYPHDSPTQLAREFNMRFTGRPVTIHAARKWLVGESIPTQDKLRILAQWLGVTAEWLRFGDADLPEIAKRPHRELEAHSEEGRLIAELLELDPYHRRLAHDFVMMLAEKHAQERQAGSD